MSPIERVGIANELRGRQPKPPPLRSVVACFSEARRHRTALGGLALDAQDEQIAVAK